MLLQGKVLSGTYWLYLTWREPGGIQSSRASIAVKRRGRIPTRTLSSRRIL